MTAELLNEAAEDSETVVIAWLSPLRPGATGNARRSGDPLPYTWVAHLESNEDVDEGTVDALVSVHTMCDKNLGGQDKGWVAARDEADKTHRRMLLLARHLEDVPLSGGRFATIDYVNPAGMSGWIPYGDDQIIQKIGRYTIGLSYAPVP